MICSALVLTPVALRDLDYSRADNLQFQRAGYELLYMTYRIRRTLIKNIYEYSCPPSSVK